MKWVCIDTAFSVSIFCQMQQTAFDTFKITIELKGWLNRQYGALLSHLSYLIVQYTSTFLSKKYRVHQTVNAPCACTKRFPLLYKPPIWRFSSPDLPVYPQVEVDQRDGGEEPQREEVLPPALVADEQLVRHQGGVGLDVAEKTI